jgi:hypothetical protein
MSAVPTRRAFVRHAVVGLPALAGASAFPASAHAAGTVLRGSDLLTSQPGMERIVRELSAVHNRIASHGRTAEDLRAAAWQIRTLITYRRASGRDEQIAEAIRTLVAREQPQRLLSAEPDLSPLRVGLLYYGVRADPPRFAIPDAAARTAAFDTLATSGVESFYMDGYELIEHLMSQGTEASLCQLIQDMMTVMEAAVSVMCLGATFIPALAPECFAASVVLALLKTMYLFMSC